jgi:hypothetical protein
VAEALVTGYGFRNGELDLGHVTIILDACQQYTVGQGILTEIEKRAHKARVRIIGYPTIISNNQPYMFGSLPLAEFREVPDSPQDTSVPPEGELVGDTIYTRLDELMRPKVPGEEGFTLGDILGFERIIANNHREALKDLLRLLPFDTGPARWTGDKGLNDRGRRIIQTGDPAVFSPEPGSAYDIFIRAASEAGIQIPTSVCQDSEGVSPTFIEISNVTDGSATVLV